MTIPTIDGWLWSTEWEAPEESAYTVGAKLAQINSVRFSQVRDWVYDRNKTNQVLGWEKLRSILASERFRFCEECLATGYHASIFQLWHVRQCPTHYAPLRTKCVHCSTPTPLFELRDRPRTSVLTPSLVCPHCAKPYGRVSAPLDIGTWRAPDGVERMTYLVSHCSWLQSPYQHLALLNFGVWGAVNPDPSEAQAEARGQKLYDYLHSMFGATSAFFVGTRYGPIDRKSLHVSRASIHLEPKTPTHEKVDSIESLDNYAEYTVTPSHGCKVPISSKVPYLIHAAEIWRTQHPCHLAGMRKISAYILKPSQPMAQTPFAHLWQVHAASWDACLQLAKLWHLQLSKLEEESAEPARDAALMAIRPEWSSRLGKWMESKYSPVLLTEIESFGDRRVYIGVPG